MHNLTTEQTDLLARLESTRKNGEFLRTYLLVGAKHLLNSALINAIARLFFSANDNCKNSRLLAAGFHPDMLYISPEDSNTIKIESIRELQINVTKSLSVAKYKLVIINPADKLNIQAASALLKILEEPPQHTIFVLLAEQLSNIPVTVVSRCHKYFLRDYSLQDLDKSYFDVAKYYAKDDERSALIANKAQLITEILNMVNGQTTASAIANQLQEYKLENVVWFLYLLTAQLVNISVFAKSDDDLLLKLANSQSLAVMYNLLDKLQQAQKMQIENITLNNSLAIENILLEYKTC